jgi:hypothetical protein|tara:strand:+ start:2593 stop:2799 length:207 start_codon:yes stop_codon:yes gene_type:complete
LPPFSTIGSSSWRAFCVEQYGGAGTGLQHLFGAPQQQAIGTDRFTTAVEHNLLIAVTIERQGQVVFAH